MYMENLRVKRNAEEQAVEDAGSIISPGTINNQFTLPQERRRRSLQNIKFIADQARAPPPFSAVCSVGWQAKRFRSWDSSDGRNDNRSALGWAPSRLGHPGPRTHYPSQMTHHDPHNANIQILDMETRAVLARPAEIYGLYRPAWWTCSPRIHKCAARQGDPISLPISIAKAL